MAAPEAQIPHWDEVVATPEFQSADSTQREQFRQSYRFDLAKQAFLAGMPEKQVDANLKAFDDYSKPGVFQRIKNSLTGQPTAASAAAMGLDAASRTAAQSQSVMAGMDGTPVNTRASRYAPLSAQGLSGLERQVSANPQQAIEQSTGTGVIDRAKRGVAQDMANQRTVTAHAGLNRAVESALGLPSKSIAATEEDPIARAKAAPGTVYDDYQDGPVAEVSTSGAAKISARSISEGLGSLFRGTYNIDRLADPLAGKLAALITGNPATDAQVRAYLELERQGKLQPWQDFGTKVMDWMMPVSKEDKDAVEQPLFLGNPLKGEAPKLNPRASLSQFIAKGGQVFGQMAPIIAAGVLTGPAGGALAGAAQAADEGGDEESSRIKKMSAEDLNKIPVYREYLKQGATPEEAKQATAADAGRWASVVQGMIGSLDGLLFKGAGEAAKKAVVKGFVKGGVEQGLQEPAESIGARVAASVAIGEKLDPNRIGAGTYDDSFLGFATGGPIKAVTESGKPKQVAQAPENPAPKTQATPAPVTDLPTDAVPVDILRGKPEPATAAQSAPVVETAVDKAAHEAATSPLNDKAQPTDAQKEAGNYAKGSAKVGGLDISIETPQGSTRSGTDADGKAWSVPMQDHYGYVRGTEGKDNDHVDVFIKPGTPEDWKGPVYVVDQVDPKTGKLDEHKTIIGAASEQEARDIYQRNYAPGWNGLGDITRLPMAAFKSWVKDGAKREPLGDISQWKPQEQPDATNVPAEPGVQPTGRADLPAGDSTTQEPPIQRGMTRLYHGSATHGRYDGKAWFSTDKNYAANYRGKDAELQYVDYPTDEINKIADPDGYGQTPEKGYAFNVELDSSTTGLRKPLFASARPAGAVSADVNAEALTDKAAVTSLANEIGWAERGGQMIRAPGSDGTVGTETISRTQWIPKSDFWPGRPKTGGALSEKEAQAALTKFERGDFLTKREQRFIQYAKQFAADRDAQQPAASEPTKALAPEDINEAEFEHWKQTGEPGFGWMPIAEALDSATDAELAALDRLLEQGPITDERAAMRALGFTDEEITATLGPDTAAGRNAADTSQGQPAADAQADRGGTAATQKVARPSLELTGQTEGQIRGEEARRAKQQADQRARDNAPSPDDFTLTGSDRAADVGAARGQAAMFQRGKMPTESEALKSFGESPELFKYPKSDKKDLAGIAADIAPGLVVTTSKKFGTEQKYELSRPGVRGVAMVWVREPNPYGDDIRSYENGYDADHNPVSLSQTLPGRNQQILDIDQRDVWLDVSRLQPGEAGSRIYAIVANYAYNNGDLFIGDPDGLTDKAMVRRTENMLNSALKFGTTEHLAPHPRQVRGAAELGIAPLDWVYGDHVGNVHKMIDVLQGIPQNLMDDADGPISPTLSAILGIGGPENGGSDVGAAAASRGGRAPLGYGSTPARHRIFESVVRRAREEERGAGESPGSVLARALSVVRQLGLATDGEERVLYKRDNPALSTPPETTALLRRLSVLESIRTCLG